jgi:hypothetical protein
MNGRLILSCAAVLLAGCSTNPEKRVPRAAADAMTGSPWTLTAVASLTMEGSGVIHDAAQQFAVTSFKRVLNFRKRQWRGDMTVVSDSPRSSPELLSMGLIGDHAFKRNIEGEARDPQLKSEVLRHPIGFLQAAFSGTLPLSGTRSSGGMDAVDLTVDGTVYTLFLDSVTKLPAKISSPGDVAIETTFPSYKTIHGYKLPSRIVTKVGALVIEDLKIDQQVASADSVELTVPGKL